MRVEDLTEDHFKEMIRVYRRHALDGLLLAEYCKLYELARALRETEKPRTADPVQQKGPDR